MNDSLGNIRRLFERHLESLTIKTAMHPSEFVAEMLPLVTPISSVTVSLHGNSVRFTTADEDVIVEYVPAIRSMFRAICAALSAWAAQHGAGSCSPYGGCYEFYFDDGNGITRMRLDFTNTTSMQEFRIDVQERRHNLDPIKKV
jgi:hypothetical protein